MSEGRLHHAREHGRQPLGDVVRLPRLKLVGFHPGGTPKPYYGTKIPAFGSVAWFRVESLRPAGDGELPPVRFVTHVEGPIANGGGTGPKDLFGPAGPNGYQGDLESNDGPVGRVPTFP